MPYSPTNAAWSGVNKATTKATKVARETLSWITPIGKPMKAAKAGKAVSKALKAAKKTKPLANPKSAVRVKPPAKTKPNKPNASKLKAMEHNTRYRAGESAYRQNMKDQTKANYSGYGQGIHGDATLEASIAQSEARVGRKAKVLSKKLSDTEKRKATTPKNANTASPFNNRIKINSQRNLKKK
jgi:hypothetical protein